MTRSLPEPEPGPDSDPDSDPDSADLLDRLDPRPVVSSEVVYRGLIWDVRRDVVDLGVAGLVRRDLIEHPGAVAIVALDAQDRLALIQQYRHPIETFGWEIPAGLLDQRGESPVHAAARELAEEADLVAARWEVLLDYATSPGYTSEQIRIFLARDVTQVPADARHTRHGEELGMPLHWVALDAALEAVLESRIHNPHTVIGILAAHAARARNWADLRPALAPWPQHRDHR